VEDADQITQTSDRGSLNEAAFYPYPVSATDAAMRGLFISMARSRFD
jgi:hypothetical protein